MRQLSMCDTTGPVPEMRGRSVSFLHGAHPGEAAAYATAVFDQRSHDFLSTESSIRESSDMDGNDLRECLFDDYDLLHAREEISRRAEAFRLESAYAATHGRGAW